MRTILKWVGIILGGLLGLVVLLLVGLVISSQLRLNRTFTVQPEPLVIPNDPASIAEGRRLAAVYCQDCHGSDLAGKEFFNDPAIAVINSSNLTSGQGGIGAYYSDEDWVRAIRHGVDPQGRTVIVMPSNDFYHFSDEDLGQLIAYLKTVPPVDHTTETFRPTLIGRVLVTVGAFGDVFIAESIDHSAPRPTAPATVVDAEYGAYLVNTFGCRTCHGEQLAGGANPDPAGPPGPDLTGSGHLKDWSQADFIQTMRTRRSDWMPFESLSHMTDEELTAIFLYLQSLPGLETAAR